MRQERRSKIRATTCLPWELLSPRHGRVQGPAVPAALGVNGLYSHRSACCPAPVLKLLAAVSPVPEGSRLV